MTKGPSLTLMEKTIPFCPVLGKTFGICGALLLQQVHFSLCRSVTHWKEGHLWVWSTVQSVGYAMRTSSGLRREDAIRMHLEEAQGLLEWSKPGASTNTGSKYDRTLWYRVNYAALMGRCRLHLGDEYVVEVNHFSSNDPVRVTARLSFRSPYDRTDT
jgi:hypothetical protein